MLQKTKLWVSAVLLALLLSVTFLTGNAAAVYVSDGAVQNGVTGGWDVVEYGACVTGIDATGNMIVDTSRTSRADCIANTFPAYTTQADCGSTTNAEGAAHFWASTCVDAGGNGISLAGLDRTASICIQKGGTMKYACTSAWQFMGPSGQATEGFCYAGADLTSLYSTQASCPTTAGYSWNSGSGKCLYTFGISGYNGTTSHTGALQAIKNLAGTTVVAIGGEFDASIYTSMGQCLANGFSWNNYVPKTGETALSTTPNPSVIATAANGTMEGCLRCHNTTSQYNTYAERWKETYNKTGHKNMLRKVTPGMNWAGPDGHIYTTDGTNTINFVDGTANVGGTDRLLFYLYGNWMAPEPRLVYNTNGDGVTSNGYSCASCHTSGWSNASAGVCYPDSTKTTAAACVSPNTWVASTGVQGTVGAEPQASFPGITGVVGKWDLDGIQCSRCHDSTNPAVSGTGTHHGSMNSNSINNLCFGCHQSPATTYVAQNIGGIDYTANAKILDPAMIPTGTHHGADWGREFNGHVLGNAFMNSPHSRFTGTLVPNSLGKYDIAGGTYASSFSGFVCRSSTTAGGGSILKTNADGTVIHSLEDCNVANGKMAGDTASYGYWQSEGQGKCTTCHEVHQSIVPEAGAAEPFIRECQTCHGDSTNAAGYKSAGVQQIDPAVVRHPWGAGTPFAEMATKPNKSCEICHMPMAGMPMHLWRINTDPSYDTFPTKTAFYGGSCSIDTYVSESTCTTAGGTWTAATKDRRATASPDGSYENAVWVDLDAACGQCHGGGTNSTDNPPVLGVPYYTKASLSSLARNMHYSDVDARFTWAADSVVSYQVNFAAGSCSGPAGSSCSYEWDFGDGAIATGEMVSHVYADATAVSVMLTVTNTTTGASGSVTQPVTPVVVNTPPVASKTTPMATGMSVSLTDTSTDAQDDQSQLVVTVLWGDGTTSTGAGGSLFSKTYALGGTYTIKHSVRDSGGLTSSSASSKVTITEKYSISGTVADGAGAPVSGATMYLKSGTTVKKIVKSAADGTYTFVNLLKGCYYAVPSMTGRTFIPSLQTVCVGPSKSGIDFTAQ